MQSAVLCITRYSLSGEPRQSLPHLDTLAVSELVDESDEREVDALWADLGTVLAVAREASVNDGDGAEQGRHSPLPPQPVAAAAAAASAVVVPSVSESQHESSDPLPLPVARNALHAEGWSQHTTDGEESADGGTFEEFFKVPTLGLVFFRDLREREPGICWTCSLHVLSCFSLSLFV